MTTIIKQKMRFNYKKFLEDVYQQSYFLNGFVLCELNMTDFPRKNALTYIPYCENPILRFISHYEEESMEVFVDSEFSGGFMILNEEVRSRALAKLKEIFGHLDHYNELKQSFYFPASTTDVRSEDKKFEVVEFFREFTDDELDNEFIFVDSVLPRFVAKSSLRYAPDEIIGVSNDLVEVVGLVEKIVRYKCDKAHGNNPAIANLNFVDEGTTLNDVVYQYIDKFDNPQKYGYGSFDIPYVFYGYWYMLSVTDVSNGFFVERIPKFELFKLKEIYK